MASSALRVDVHVHGIPAMWRPMPARAEALAVVRRQAWEVFSRPARQHVVAALTSDDGMARDRAALVWWQRAAFAMAALAALLLVLWLTGAGR